MTGNVKVQDLLDKGQGWSLPKDKGGHSQRTKGSLPKYKSMFATGVTTF